MPNIYIYIYIYTHTLDTLDYRQSYMPFFRDKESEQSKTYLGP